MSAQLILNFNNAQDLIQVLQLLKDHGLDQLILQSNIPEQKSKSEKKSWAFGVGNLNGSLDKVNIRDYAHE